MSITVSFDEVLGCSRSRLGVPLLATHYASSGWSDGAVALVASRRRNAGGPRLPRSFDGPQRYFDTIYSDAYCKRARTARRTTSTEPDEIAPYI